MLSWLSVIAWGQVLEVSLGAPELPDWGVAAPCLSPSGYAQFAAARGAPPELVVAKRPLCHGAALAPAWLTYTLSWRRGALWVATSAGEQLLTLEGDRWTGSVGEVAFTWFNETDTLSVAWPARRRGELRLEGGPTLAVWVDDVDGDGPALPNVGVDVDQDGEVDFGGTEAARVGEVLLFGSSAWVPRLPAPDHLVLTPSAERPVVALGETPPVLSRLDVAGVLQRVGEPRGEPVLLDFWGTWCVGCIQAFPRVTALYREGLPVLGVALNDPEARVKAFLKEREEGWPTLVFPPGEASRKVIADWGLHSFPTYAVLDPEGRLRYYGGDLDRAEREIRSLLGR